MLARLVLDPDIDLDPMPNIRNASGVKICLLPHSRSFHSQQTRLANSLDHMLPCLVFNPGIDLQPMLGTIDRTDDEMSRYRFVDVNWEQEPERL